LWLDLSELLLDLLNKVNDGHVYRVDLALAVEGLDVDCDARLEFASL
jgi:hypothetical protein